MVQEVDCLPLCHILQLFFCCDRFGLPGFPVSAFIVGVVVIVIVKGGKKINSLNLVRS